MPPLFLMLVFPAMLAVSRGAGQPDQAELAHIASLHRWVYELQTLPSSPVHAAARELGLRYIEGRGVERDLIQGCALFERASWNSLTDPAARADAERLKKVHCSGLSPNEEHEAWELASCGIFGVTPQVIALAPDSQIDISRRGLVLDTPAGRTTAQLSWGPVGCGHQVALLRYARVDPPVGLALPARHLLEVAEWASAPDATGTPDHGLQWFLFDITSRIELVAIEGLEGGGAGSAWPMPPLPAALERGPTFTMQPSGAIRWEIAGEPTHRGEFK